VRCLGGFPTSRGGYPQFAGTSPVAHPSCDGQLASPAAVICGSLAEFAKFSALLHSFGVVRAPFSPVIAACFPSNAAFFAELAGLARRLPYSDAVVLRYQ
jgi:hypothetical protein